MSVSILKNDYNKAKKILESYYKDGIVPESVNDFFQFASNLNEAVTITIRDDKSGKTVEINTDDVLDDKATDASSDNVDFESSFDNVTFNNKETLAFTDDEESADEDEDESNDDETDNSDDTKSTDDNSNESKESDDNSNKSKESDDDSEKSKEDNQKKKFRFKPKRKNESKTHDFTNVINESVMPSVMDYVKIKSNGLKGQVISQFGGDDNNMVVHVDGHTILCSPNDVELVNPKIDTLPPHMKFDPLTLKGIYESYVSCGLFVNGMKITPNDCYVKVSDYFSTNENDEVNIVIEGEKTSAIKRYVNLTENINDVIDVANYVPGKIVHNGMNEDILIHIGDYMKYKNLKESYETVRVLSFVNESETTLNYVSGSYIRLNDANDIYISENEISINDAINKLLK